MNPSGTIKMYDQAIERHLTERDEFLVHAESLLQRGSYHEAMIFAKDRLSAHPEDADARMMIGILLMEMGDEQEAIAVFEQITNDIMRLAGVYEHLGDLLSKRGALEDAWTCYQTFLDLKPNAMQTERVLVKIENLLDGGDRDRNEKPTNNVTGAFKTITIAELYLSQGHVDAAEKILKEILQKDPRNEKAHALLQQAGSSAKRAVMHQRDAFSEAVIGELNCWLRNMHRLKRD